MKTTVKVAICLSALALIAIVIASSPTCKEEVTKIEDELGKLKTKIKELSNNATGELKKVLSELEDDVKELKAKFQD